MSTQSVLQTWRDLLPPDVCVSAGPFVDAAPLTASERASAGSVAPERLRELENSRSYGKHALALCGVENVDLPIGPDRAPLWPPGIIGSITHVRGGAGGHVSAAVARIDSIRLGIDVELETGLHPPVWPHVLTAGELERVHDLPISRRVTEVQTVWCAKEAMAKALRRRIEPTDIDTTPDDATGYYNIVALSNPGRAFYGRIAKVGGFILAAVVVPQDVQFKAGSIR
jgi:4'-phosphopantetheinyl transferase EntD